MSNIANRKIIKVKDGSFTKTDDILAVEEPIEISLSMLKADPPIVNKNISITMRTPGNDADLATGFLYTEGIIFQNHQIDSVVLGLNTANVMLNNTEPIDLSKIERHFYTSSSCGVCGKSSIDSIKTVCKIVSESKPLLVSKEILHHLPKKLQAKQEIFDQTGGLHAAALFDYSGNLLYLREDVGRHNAVDKLIGAAFIENKLPLNQHLLLLSGRASFELIQKASMAGIQFVLAVGAPSSLAVELAEEFGITLIGFLNAHRFNIYCGSERVVGS